MVVLLLINFSCDLELHAHSYIHSILMFFRSVSLLTCLEKGNACLRSIPVSDAPENSTTASHITWNVCSSGKIICSSVDKSENYALFGG